MDRNKLKKLGLDPSSSRVVIQGFGNVGGMAAKLEAAAHALKAGVSCVRIAGVAGVSDLAAGTRLVPSPSPVR